MNSSLKLPADSCAGSNPCACAGQPELTFPEPASQSTEVCCGPPPGPPTSPYERPGYKLFSYVEKFIDTPAGQVPIVKTRLERPDHWGTLGARLGGTRDFYRTAPKERLSHRPAPWCVCM